MKQHILIGVIYGIIGQIFSFLQLQASIKFGLNQKYPVLIVLASVPISWLFIKSVENFIAAFNGSIWESRMIGFSLGVIIFALLGWLIFKEPITLKTIVCLSLGFSILAIQLLWK